MWRLYISILFISISKLLISQQSLELELELQKRGELVVAIQEEHIELIENIHSVSIERPINGQCQVYLNEKQYKYFVANKIPFIPQIAPSFLYDAKMATDIKELENWDTYPSYETYLDMMLQFTIDFPEYCKLDTIGYSVENRLLLALKISDNVVLDETEPEFFYSSSMHGDELVGSVLMLRLAHYLLNNLENKQVANLVNGIEIYINPLANPDGTYFTSNNTVQGAIRSNANGINLNRNYPDPEDGEHPDGYDYQSETLAMMDFMENRNFVMSMNHHGGAEVINYPWDTFSKLHADNEWFEFISRNYADTVHMVDEFYLTDLENGITNGYAWYTISGGRQDYANYFLQCREVTSELSTVKLPSASLLPAYWDKNYKSLLNFMEQTLYGVSGFVTDSLGNPIDAKITVLDHDFDNSQVFTQDSGVYYRFLKEGIYSFLFETDGYQPIQVDEVIVKDFERTPLSVKFKIPLGISQNDLINMKVYPNPAKDFVIIELPQTEHSNFDIYLYDCFGIQVFNTNCMDAEVCHIPLLNIQAGIYIMSIYNEQVSVNRKLVVQ